MKLHGACYLVYCYSLCDGVACLRGSTSPRSGRIFLSWFVMHLALTCWHSISKRKRIQKKENFVVLRFEVY